jgi:hypothetical protein
MLQPHGFSPEIMGALIALLSRRVARAMIRPDNRMFDRPKRAERAELP